MRQIIAQSQQKENLHKRFTVRVSFGQSKDPYNKNELTATFTPLGQEALEKYRQVRMTFRDRFTHYFSSLSEDERGTIGQFLSYIEDVLTRMHR